eukprot:755157-Hanusia_phi.AAC.2
MRKRKVLLHKFEISLASRKIGEREQKERESEMRSLSLLIVGCTAIFRSGEAFQTGGLRPNLILRQPSPAQCRYRSKANTIVALSSPPPPPPPAQSSGTKTLTKSELGDLNLQLWEAAKNGDTAEVVK